MLDGGVNDYVEAKALSYRRNYIDVYSASWGPEDDGKTVDGPGPLARRAFIEGVLKVAPPPPPRVWEGPVCRGGLPGLGGSGLWYPALLRDAGDGR